MASRICGTFPDPSTQVETNFNDILYVIHLGAAVCEDGPSAKGPGNMVVVNSSNMVQSTFAGPGARR